MKIDDNENIDIWLIGNTGLRSPNRIRDGFIAFSQSPYVGNLHGKENEIAFMAYLNEKGIINNQAGRDSSGSHARKWRLMFEKFGFIYPQAQTKYGFTQDEIGPADEITPFGKVFLQANTVPAIQECFLRSLSVEYHETPDGKGFFSPLRWVLAIMLELERRTGSSELHRIEFGLWVHTTNPSYDINDVVDHILDLRARRENAPSKRVFDKNEIEKRSIHYALKKDNFLDYSDMNMRYLRISGILQRKGRGLMIVPAKHAIAEALKKSTASIYTDKLTAYRILVLGAPLPTDDVEMAKKVLNDLIRQMKDRHILYELPNMPLTTAAEVNTVRAILEEQLSRTDELMYAAEQKDKWREIADYMTLLIKGGGSIDYNDDYRIEIPKDETPVYFEWTLWRAALAIGNLVRPPYEIRGFKLDADFMPVSAAGGGRGDLYWEFDDYLILTEVTMSTSSRQEAMEGEPVRRHVSDAVSAYHKPVYGMFVAIKIDTNTAETFRHGVWYAKDDEKQRLNIVPLTLEQFRKYFVDVFESDNITPQKFVNLINYCAMWRDEIEAPGWKQLISETIMTDKSKLLNKKLNAKEFARLYTGKTVKSKHPRLSKAKIIGADKENNIVILSDPIKDPYGFQPYEHSIPYDWFLAGYEFV